ncbi:hypothetical protein [Streptomyces gilvosporeus]|uniref:hypothetical protein n=1 Tax=Streptomyces gilvosporeus TaxID=553510 RepID=UPI00131B7E94|nr:hypothetical protein [Streptomyces gilvosporeus]
MRDLTSLLYIWLGEPLRRALRTARQRARNWLCPPPPPPMGPVIPPGMPYHRGPRPGSAAPPGMPPHRGPRPGHVIHRRGPLPAHVLARAELLDGHEVRLIRPYYVDYVRSIGIDDEFPLSEEIPA